MLPVFMFIVIPLFTYLEMPEDFTFNSPGNFVPGNPTSAMYTVMGDRVALEGNEVFELVINVIDPVVSRQPRDPPVILQPRVTITINDENGMWQDVVLLTLSPGFPAFSVATQNKLAAKICDAWGKIIKFMLLPKCQWLTL